MLIELQFIEALELSDLNTIKKLVTQDPNLLVFENQEYCNSLFIIVEKAKENTEKEILLKKEVLEYLLQAKPIFLEQTNKNGYNILMAAVQYGHNETIKFLLDKEPTLLNKTFNNGTTILMIAAKYRHNETIKLLLENDPTLLYKTENSGSTALSVAACYGHNEAIELFLETDFNLLHKSNNDGITILMAAAQYGNNETIKFLLKKDPTLLYKTDNDGDTVLMVAACNGHTETIKLLLENDSTLLNKTGNEGRTIFMAAAYYGYTETIKFLLENDRTLLHKTDNNGRTVLMVAAQFGHNETIKFLLEKDPTLLLKTDNSGRTVLMVAAYYGRNETIKLLLEEDRSLLHKTDNSGGTILMTAAQYGHNETIKLLLEKDPTLLFKTDNKGSTILMVAACCGCNETIKLLLEIDKSLLPNTLNFLNASSFKSQNPQKFRKIKANLKPYIDEYKTKKNALSQSKLAQFIEHAYNSITNSPLGIEEDKYHFLAKELFFLEAKLKNERLVITKLTNLPLYLPNTIKSLSFNSEKLINFFQDWKKMLYPTDTHFQSLLIKHAIEMESFNKERYTKAQEKAFQEQSASLLNDLLHLTTLMNKTSELDLIPIIKGFRESLIDTQKIMTTYQAIVSKLLKYPNKIAGNFKEWLEILERLTQTVETSEEQLIVFQENFKKVYNIKAPLIQENIQSRNINKARKQLQSIKQIYLKAQTLINTVNQARKELSVLNDKIKEANEKNNKMLQHAIKKSNQALSLPIKDENELWQAFDRLEAQFKNLLQKRETLKLQQERKKPILNIRKENLTKKPFLEVHTDKVTSLNIFHTKMPKALTLGLLSDLPNKMVVNKEKALLKQLLQIETLEVDSSLYCYALLGTIARLMEHYKNSQGQCPFSKETAKNFRNTIFHHPELINKVKIEEVRDLGLQILSFIEDKEAWKTQLLEVITSPLFKLGIGKIENIILTLEICKEQLKQAKLELNLYPLHGIYSPVEQAALGFIHAKISTYASTLKRIDKNEYQWLNKEFHYKLNKYILLGNQYRHAAFPSSTFSISNHYYNTSNNGIGVLKNKPEEEHKAYQNFSN
ncbi:MAG: Protein 21 [Francisellaceae bacterium]|nr:Protein 21 [Francisellaceae bacterium]